MPSRRKAIPDFLTLFFEFWGIKPVVRDHPHFLTENWVDEPAAAGKIPNPLQDLWRLHRLSTSSEAAEAEPAGFTLIQEHSPVRRLLRAL